MKRTTWKSALAVIPAVVMSLVPKLVCPACWPAYAGLVTALGLGFLTETRWLLPLTAGALLLALAALAHRDGWRLGRPFQLGLLGAGLILFGKFWYDPLPLVYIGAAALVVAMFWRGGTSGCRACQNERK